MRFAKLMMTVFTVFILGLFLTTNTFAQTGSISGTVTDENNAPAAVASILATNTATGLPSSVQSNDSGVYKFESLPAGTYNLSITYSDLTPQDVQNVVIGAGDTKQINFALKLGTAAKMFRSTHPFFKWSEVTWLGKMIRSHQYPFAVIEVVHLFGLTLLLGGIFLMSLRLFGFIMRDMPVPQVARQLGWISFWGLVVMVATGASLFASEALKCYGNTMYWYKMAFFFPATIFHFTMYRSVTRSNNSTALMRGLTGFLALFLWFGVAVFGRAIGYF